MQHYRVVVCECGCEYNPEGRKICPAAFCGRAVPEDPAMVEAKLIEAEAELLAAKKDKKESDDKKIEAARVKREKASVS